MDPIPFGGKLKKIFIKYWQLFTIAIVIIGLDQITKLLVRNNLAFGESWSPFEWLAPYARIVHWNNTGAAFGILQGYNIVFMVLAIIVSSAIIYYYPRVDSDDKVIRFALGMQLGGALGNLIDRITVGQVTDFMSVGTFAVFNVADSCISVGVAVLLLGIWISDKKAKSITSPEVAEIKEVNPKDGDEIA